MSLKKLREHLRSVAFRLTVLYTLLFGCVLLGGGILLYYRGSAYILRLQDAELRTEMRERLPVLAREDLKLIQKEFASESANLGRGDCFFRLLAMDGTTLAESDLSAWQGVRVDLRDLTRITPGEFQLQTVPVTDGPGHVRVLIARTKGNRVLQIGFSMKDNERFLMHLLNVATVILVAMLALGAIIGWVMARRAMAGVEDVTAAAARITEGHFDDRVQVLNAGTEIEQLSLTFNRMVGCLQAVMHEMQQVNDNIAHDLRSPITCIRGLAEAAVVLPQTPAEAAETAGSILEECDRLLGLINTMLDIAEAEAGIRGPTRETVPLADVVSQAVELFQAVAEENGIRLCAVIHATPVVSADVRKLQRALANLLDNALKYSGTGSQVTVTLSQQAGTALVAVSDTGPGIPANDLPLVFDRFYRGDSSRNLPGNGLGLSLASAVVRAHGGTLTVQSSPGHGSTFTMMLPCERDLAQAHS